MKKILFCLISLLILESSAQDKPKLVVGIVVDQMKMEYLYRFSDDFSSNGFKRLIQEGFTYHNMHYNFMPTYTAPGHATIYTGAVPAVHGIVGNEWFNKATGKELYCTDDEQVKTIGDGTEKEGMMSPRNLQSTTITDELKLATNFKGKVIGISIKDRGAILPAGHFADWAFWYSKTGAFISSTYYGEKLPDWVTQFNNEKNYFPYLEKGWSLLKPIETYNESLVDDNPYEGKLYKKSPVFPYDLKEMYEANDAGVLRVTPFGNDVLANLAKRAIEKENLGKDDITDFLAVSFSSTDYIGHTFGPRSIEIQDTYLRLDLTIADFLNYLDKEGFQYGVAGKDYMANGYSYHDDKAGFVKVEAEDVVFNLYQPRSMFLKILMEPKTMVEDSMTYDITSWSLPYAYGLKAYALKDRLNPAGKVNFENKITKAENAYAYLARWQSFSDLKFLSAIMQKGIKVRSAAKSFEMEGLTFPA